MTDPILTEIVRQGLTSAAEQMKIALRRTAFSPIVYDMLDFCCALYDREYGCWPRPRPRRCSLGP